MVRASHKQLDWDMCVAMGMATGPRRKTSKPHLKRRGGGTPHSSCGGGDRNSARGGKEADGARRNSEKEIVVHEAPPPSLTNSVGRMAQVRHQGVVDRGHSRLTLHAFSAEACSNKKVGWF